jgi:hypothetical protein
MKPATEARARYFNESGTMIPPFVSADWRGCVLDRDSYDNTRIPRYLFEAIATAAGSTEITVCGYFPNGEACSAVAATWGAFSSYLLARDNWSLEYVAFDASQRWALLADADATIFGAESALASAIDKYLAFNGTSLVQLTDTEFPALNPEQQAARYVLAVSGR